MKIRRISKWSATVVAAVLLVGLVSAWSSARQRSDAAKVTTVAVETTPTTSQILREGSVLKDVVGVFRVTGDRVAFYPSEGSHSYRALENLALERVAKMLKETLRDREWIVSGTVTEYRGANYLLVTRSVLKNAEG